LRRPWCGDRRTRGIHRRQTHVPLERRLTRWGKVHDIERPQVGSSVGGLDRWIANDRVFANRRLARARGHKDALRISDHDIRVENIARGGPNDADTEVVGGIREAIAVYAVQPDPAVVTDNSNTAAWRRR
jgi:hypothetical protein